MEAFPSHWFDSPRPAASYHSALVLQDMAPRVTPALPLRTQPVDQADGTFIDKAGQRRCSHFTRAGTGAEWTMAQKAARCHAAPDAAPTQTAPLQGSPATDKTHGDHKAVAPLWMLEDLKMLGRCCNLTDQEMVAMEDPPTSFARAVDPVD